MPITKCPHCNDEKFYVNITGTTKLDKCKNCGKEIEVPYKSSQTLNSMEVKCIKCGKMFETSYIPSKQYTSFVIDTRLGTSTKSNRTPDLYGDKMCEECKSKGGIK